MRFLLIVFSLLFSLCSYAKEQSFFLYVTNNTPYTVHLGKSNYNKTPFTLLTTEVAPNSQTVMIGEVKKLPTVTKPVSFYARIGDNPSYRNTPLVRYGLVDRKKEVRLEPHYVYVDEQPFVTEVWAYGPDENHSILLSIDPAPNAKHRSLAALGR